MSIEYSEIGGFLPVGTVFWSGDVEDDGYSVLVVLANWTLVGACSIGFNESVRLGRMLSRLVVG